MQNIYIFINLPFSFYLLFFLIQFMTFRNVASKPFRDGHYVYFILQPQHTTGKSKEKLSEALKSCNEILKELFSKKHSVNVTDFI